MGYVVSLKEKQTESFLGWRERQEKLAANRAESSKATEKVQESQEISKSDREAKSSPARPVTDEYIKGEERVPIGLYRMEKDEKGNPKIHFDDPDQVHDRAMKDDKTQKSGAKNSKRADGKKPETYRCDTNKVDREIEKLKKEKQELEGQIRTEKDEKKAEELERRLNQVKKELQQKDNDTYRRQHAHVTKV